MAKFDWTTPQALAIEARGDILVSAAAGSGKTAVLVERVMRMIESECNIDELLIVTFTRSAAAQMKEKIAAAIEAKIEKEPENKHYRLQQILLEKARISTIDAFCADVLKNGFEHLKDIDISMSYKNLDEAGLKVLSREVADEVLDEFYDTESKSFRALMDVFTCGKDDLKIYDIINILHSYTSAFVNPKARLQQAAEAFRVGKVEASPWGKLVLQAMCEYFELALSYYERALQAAAKDPATQERLAGVLEEDRLFVSSALKAAAAGDWQRLYELKDTKFAPFPRKTKTVDPELHAKVLSLRNAAKGVIKDSFSMVIETQEEFARDNAAVYPIVSELAKVYARYEERLFERKLERQEFEFSDIAYLALKILVDENGEPTEAALEYRKKYKGILVDEYQDTNGVQDLLFRTISDHNLFVVGDVKQSIYRFRQAMPEIFIQSRKALKPYEKGADSGYILLNKNFRSEKPITDFVNFLFKKLMSESLGDVEYNEDEYLIPGVPGGTEGAASPELHILENRTPEGREKLSDAAFEAAYIASLIREQVQSGESIKIGEERRALHYNDFCVLVRSNTHIAELKAAFEECGIPYSCEGGENLFETPEIMLVMSFLRAIDNPLRDVDLIAVMYSEIFGFTAQELSLIRIAKRKGSFYSAVCALAGEGNQRCQAFLESLEAYRTAAATNEPAEFLRMLYQKTALPEIICAGPSGEVGRANLMKFISVVKLYSDAGYYGLTGLVRFLEKVRGNSSDITSAYLPEGESKVKIMTIHKSKGLEFPVVIVAFANKNNNHNGRNIVLNRTYGVGLKPKSAKNNVRYNTLSYAAIELANRREDIAEELRTLYVALTRAKAKLIVTGTYFGGVNTSAEGKIAGIAALAGEMPRPEPAWLRMNNNYFSWLIACALQHPDGKVLRDCAPDVEYRVEHSEEGRLKIQLPAFYPEERSEAPKTTFSATADTALAARIRENFAFSYAYEGSQNIESKKTPSAVAEGESNISFAFEAPAFLENKASAAAKGTATHRFMEKVSSFSQFNYESELQRMLNQGFLSEEQAKALEKKEIEAFFASALCRRMAAAERLEREYPVAYLENAGFFDAALPQNLQQEKVFVDGMIDAVFVENGSAVIVDYKTDRVKSGEELRARYAKQILLYKRAIEAMWEIPVSRCHLWSFALGEDVVVAF